MRTTGAKALVAELNSQGMHVAFGIPGGVLIPLFDELLAAEKRGDLHTILVRHEQGAAHMADGFARASGRVGLCIATSGPGATNLVTGIATAYMDSVPILALTGQVRTASIGTDAFQEADIFGITMPIVKHNYLVKSAADVPQILVNALHIASTGRPGPVLVDLPMDVATGEFEYVAPTGPDLPGYRPTVKGNARTIRRAAEVIAQAKRPLLYLGGGVILSNASDQARQLAEKLNLPTFTTLLGKGAFPETHTLALGMAGMHGCAYANLAVAECDLLIALGARFDDRITGNLAKFAPTAGVVHIDVDPAEIGKNVPVTVPIVGDCKSVLQDLIPLLKARAEDEWNRRCQELKETYPLRYEHSDEVIMPQLVVEQLYRATKGDAIVVTGVGQHQMWSAQYYRCTRPRQFLSSGGLGTMGYALPAAIGAQVACPDALVLAIDGDGSFQMNSQELATAVQEHLPVKVAILNNGYLGMVRQWQDMFYDKRYSGVDLAASPDFVKLAEAYGAVGLRAERPEEVPEVIEKALKVEDRPCVMDFRVAREANVMPMIPAGKSVDEMRIE